MPSKQRYALLKADEGDAEDHLSCFPTDHGYRIAQTSRYMRILVCIVVGQTVLILCLSFKWLEAHRSSSPSGQILYSPAQDAIVYEARRFAIEDPTPNVYMGEPSAELDKAWNNLYNYIGISQIHDSQAQLMPNVSDPIAVPMDFGAEPTYPVHVIQLSVFHQIHCLNMIRKALRADHYKDTFKGTLPWKHLDHCVEALRQAVMCASDISPVPWRYSAERDQYIPHSDVMHSCRSFDRVVDWAKENVIEARMAAFLNLTAA